MANVKQKRGIVWAASKGYVAKVEKLLENGQNVNETNKYGKSALQWAVYNDDKRMVELLLKNGADIHWKDNCGWILHPTAVNGRPSPSFYQSFSPIEMAKANGQAEIVKMMLKYETISQDQGSRKNAKIPLHYTLSFQR